MLPTKFERIYAGKPGNGKEGSVKEETEKTVEKTAESNDIDDKIDKSMDAFTKTEMKP